jgi:preprotein translocase subunit SecE
VKDDLGTVQIQKECFVAEKKAKDDKAVVYKQPNAIQRYFKETVGELRKVSWPTRKEATNLTLVVLLVTFVMSMYLGLLDLVFTRLFSLLFSS